MTDFKAKMHQIRFRLGLTRGAYSAPPDPLAGFGGPTSKDRGREGKGGEERRKEGKGGEEKGGEGRRGNGKERAMSPPLFGGSLRLCLQCQFMLDLTYINSKGQSSMR